MAGVPGRRRIHLALRGAPAMQRSILPCKGACKTLGSLPNQPKASSRGWGTGIPEFTASAEMSQDPKAFILGLHRPRMAPDGESLLLQTFLGERPHRQRHEAVWCIPESRHIPVSHRGLPEHRPAEQSCGIRALCGTQPQPPAPSIPSSGSGCSWAGPSWSLSAPAVPRASSGVLGRGVSARTSSTWQCQ